MNNPEDPDAGTRSVPFSREIYIEREDFMEVPAEEVLPSVAWHGSPAALRLHPEVRAVVKNAAGEITELRATIDTESLRGATAARRVKGTIHWVSAAHAVDAEVRLYDRLFQSADPGRWTRSTDRISTRTRSRSCRTQSRARAGGRRSRHTLSVRAAGLLLRRSRLDAGQAGLQSHRHAERHLGQDKWKSREVEK